IKNHAQEMSEDVMRKHINLYVNEYSFDLGDEGKSAVVKLMDVFSAINQTTINKSDLFAG
ncbi:MAG TPA: hypothetical protein VLR49_14830, partial [Ferruginibacter sp.]|nr:hypothetical protein [Ferruginibacter sp.]